MFYGEVFRGLGEGIDDLGYDWVWGLGGLREWLSYRSDLGLEYLPEGVILVADGWSDSYSIYSRVGLGVRHIIVGDSVGVLGLGRSNILASHLDLGWFSGEVLAPWSGDRDIDVLCIIGDSFGYSGIREFACDVLSLELGKFGYGVVVSNDLGLLVRSRIALGWSLRGELGHWYWRALGLGALPCVVGEGVGLLSFRGEDELVEGLAWWLSRTDLSCDRILEGQGELVRFPDWLSLAVSGLVENVGSGIRPEDWGYILAYWGDYSGAVQRLRTCSSIESWGSLGVLTRDYGWCMMALEFWPDWVWPYFELGLSGGERVEPIPVNRIVLGGGSLRYGYEQALLAGELVKFLSMVRGSYWR